MQEVLQLLTVMTGDHRFEEIYTDKSEGGPKNMCEVLDRIEKKALPKEWPREWNEAWKKVLCKRHGKRR